MKHNYILLFIFVFLSPIVSPSQEMGPGKYKKVENELLGDKWEGEKKLVLLIKEVGKKPCRYLTAKIGSLEDVGFVKVRILKTMKALNCDGNFDIAKKYLPLLKSLSYLQMTY
jgi:hypothetical protein